MSYPDQEVSSTTIELEKEIGQLRKLNVQLSKALLDSLSETKRLKKRLNHLEDQMAQQKMGV